MRRTALLACAMVLALVAYCPAAALAGSGAWYEIFVASFYDGNGDGAGDLSGIVEKLDYLSDGNPSDGDDLGVEGIWMMPIMPSPSYHKYDVMDYCAIDPQYGTLEDFSALISACHARGVKVILDLVLNHTSVQHPWFEAAAKSLSSGDKTYTDYYFFTQEKRDGWHEVPGAEGFYYQGVFSPDMPDLNLDNPAVRGEIERITAFWLARGADGFRLDAVTRYYEENTAKNTAFLTWLVQTVKAQNPDAYLVGEAWTDQSNIASLYKSGIDSLFNFPFAGPTGLFVECLRGQNGQKFAQKAAEWQVALREANPEGTDAVFLSNHDMARSAGTLMNDLGKQKLAAAMYLLLPGNPFVYYGEELGMLGSGKDENKRQPFVWSLADLVGLCVPPPNSDPVRQVAAGADAQRKNPDSLLSFYRSVLQARAENPEIAQGTIIALDTGEKAAAALRFDLNGQCVYVVHNLSKAEVVLPWMYGGQIVKALNSAEGGAFVTDGVLHMAGYATVILR